MSGSTTSYIHDLHFVSWGQYMAPYTYIPNFNMMIFLTHWGRDKMAAISQMSFSSACSWMKTFGFDICSLVSNSQYFNIGSDNSLALTRLQANIWTNGGISNWRIYASLGPIYLNPGIPIKILKTALTLLRYLIITFLHLRVRAEVLSNV